MPNGKATSVAPLRLTLARANGHVAKRTPVPQLRPRAASLAASHRAITCQVDGKRFTGFTAEAWRNRRLDEGPSGKSTSHGLLRLGGRTFILVLAPEVADCGNDPLSSLTARELQIAHRISDGACDKVIAHKLGISEYTVREHVRRIFCKLQVSKRTAIVRMLWRSNQGPQIQLNEGDGRPRKPLARQHTHALLGNRNVTK